MHEKVTTSCVLLEICTSRAKMEEEACDGKEQRSRDETKKRGRKKAVDTSKIDIGIIVRLKVSSPGQCLVVRHWKAGSVSAVTRLATR